MKIVPMIESWLVKNFQKSLNFSKHKILCNISCEAAFSISKKLKFNQNEVFKNTT